LVQEDLSGATVLPRRRALDDAVLIEKKPGSLAELHASYNDSGKVTYLLAEERIPVLDYVVQRADVAYRIIIPRPAMEGVVAKKIAEATAGRARTARGQSARVMVLGGSERRRFRVFDLR
jgi:hypothetical protein